MKKKRFLRLVMAYGVQRNEAARMAASVGTFGSYENLYKRLRPALVFRNVTRAFGKMFATATDAARRAFNGLSAVFAGIDIASGEDQSVVVHHVRSRCGGAPLLQIMTHEEHTAAHAAGREGAEYGKE